MSSRSTTIIPGVADEVLRRWFQDRAWKYSGGSADAVEHYFDWGALNSLLELSTLVDQIRLVGGNDETDLKHWAIAGNGQPFARINAGALHREMAVGATLVIDQADRFVPNLDRSARAISGVAKSRVQANLYGSLLGAPGFGAHRDTHDVVVIQLSGHKRWTIGEEGGAESFDVGPGDTIYMPQGTRHDVSTLDGGSLHVTFAVPIATFGEYFEAQRDSGLGELGDEYLSPDESKLRAIEARVSLGGAQGVADYIESQINDGIRGNYSNLPFPSGLPLHVNGAQYEYFAAPEDASAHSDDDAPDILSRLSPWTGTTLEELVAQGGNGSLAEVHTSLGHLVSSGRIRLARRRD